MREATRQRVEDIKKGETWEVLCTSQPHHPPWKTTALTERFNLAWSSFVFNATQLALGQKEETSVAGSNKALPLFIPDDEEQTGNGISARTQDIITIELDGEPMSIDDSITTPLTYELPILLSPLDEPVTTQK